MSRSSSSSSRRMSLGGGLLRPALRDAASMQNTVTRSSSVSRRMSLSTSSAPPSKDAISTTTTTTVNPSPLKFSTVVDGGGANGREGGNLWYAASPDSKDRRALLDDWRRSRPNTPISGGNENFLHSSSTTSTDLVLSKNNARIQSHDSRGSHFPPLPPSISQHASVTASTTMTTTVFVTEGTTALERFRMRKQQQQFGNMVSNNTNGDASTPLPASTLTTVESCSKPSWSRSQETPTISSAIHSGSSRRRSVSAQPLRNRRSSFSLPSEAATKVGEAEDGTLEHDVRSGEVNPSGSDSDPDPSEASVVDAGMRSRLREYEQRIHQLEKEKMILSMSKAPLEARLRQNEETWQKDQSRLLQEIDNLKEKTRLNDENYRDLEAQFEAIQEECRHLRFEARKANHNNNNSRSSSREHGDDNDVSSSLWSLQLQNDRDVADLREKLRAADEEIRANRLAQVSVEKELHATKIELESIHRVYEELHVEYEDMAKLTTNGREAEIKLEVLTTEHTATSAQLNAVCADLAATKARNEATVNAIEQKHRKEIENLQFEMSVLRTRAAHADNVRTTGRMHKEEDEAVLKARIEERDRRIAELEAQLLKGEELRRQLHNRIQELRGNIRVFVRTRPFLPNDGDGLNDSAIDVMLDGESLSIVDARGGLPHTFQFDRAFPPSTGQDQVFTEVSDFVQSAMDGYHVCLFSYGQTGSGKTHTMQGSGNGAMRGIIPRAVEQILNQSTIMKSQKWDFQMSASFLEIYNEELKDLLSSLAKCSAPSQPPKLAIKRSRDGKSFVDGLTEVPIEIDDVEQGMQQLTKLMSTAARSRSVASTKMNAQSSRSHSVFMLNLRGYNDDTGATVHGALNLCDLAGSERLDRSGAASDVKRLRETQAINKSLSCLGDVFNALAQGSSHVPYRNSKLTYLLQDCLSGDGKALMFVNLSPTVESSNESLCSLRFAQRVNQVELGKPTKHIQYAGAK